MGASLAPTRSSFERVTTHRLRLTGRFYELLCSRHPEVVPLFEGRSADRLAQVLWEVLVALMEQERDHAWLSATLRGVGARHASLGVTDEMYDWFGESLFDAVAEISGDAWTEQEALAWEAAYHELCSMMRAASRSMPRPKILGLVQQR